MTRQLRVLYVEDNQDDVLLFRHALRRARATIQTVSNGADAIDYLKGTGHYEDRWIYPLPDLIFLDWSLPMISGRDFLRWRRKAPPFDAVPVVALIGSGYLTEMNEANALGAEVSLPKPSGLERWGALEEILKTIANEKQSPQA